MGGFNIKGLSHSKQDNKGSLINELSKSQERLELKKDGTLRNLSTI